jgi:hypothetical protein
VTDNLYFNQFIINNHLELKKNIKKYHH